MSSTRSGDHRIEEWKLKYSAVLCFAREHGHLKIPWNDERYEGLADWLRQQFKRTCVTEEEQELLGALTEYRDNRSIEQKRWDEWDAMYRRLVAFYEEKGHFVVAIEEDKLLHNWITNQRQKYKRNSLLDERKRKLEDLGFPLEAGRQLRKKSKHTEQQVKRWNFMFQSLAEYYRKHGNCLVPRKYVVNPGLPGWIKRQRDSYHKGVLDEERQARLEELRFPWTLKGNDLRS